MLGYDAYSLLFGMSSWSSDPEVFVKRFDPETHTNDFTIDTEAHEPGGPYELPTPLAEAEVQLAPVPMPQPVAELPPTQISASSCIACHTDQSSLKDLAVEEQEVKPEESSGEG
jgi:hypothetical protein